MKFALIKENQNRISVFVKVLSILWGILMTTPAFAHEPIFGIGPHTIFKGGIGIELEVDGSGGSSEDPVLNTEILYGITSELSVTLAVPAFFDSNIFDLRGVGDISLRSKYRFWRNDTAGTQDAAAVILGMKLPTGRTSGQKTSGTGSVDFLLGLTAARESRRWYLFGDVRYLLNGKGVDNLRRGNIFFADIAFGIRPMLGEYLDPDPVLTIELNWESRMRNSVEIPEFPGHEGRSLFLSPGFFLTYRNWALKGGIQFPLYQSVDKSLFKEKFRFLIAIETHI